MDNCDFFFLERDLWMGIFAFSLLLLINLLWYAVFHLEINRLENEVVDATIFFIINK